MCENNKEGLYAEVDLNGDGINESVVMDRDGDGRVDVVAIDTDGDGVADTILMDTDGDGVADTALIDEDGDGEPDISIDLDLAGEDGKIELTNEDVEDFLQLQYADGVNELDALRNLIQALGIDNPYNKAVQCAEPEESDIVLDSVAVDMTENGRSE